MLVFGSYLTRDLEGLKESMMKIESCKLLGHFESPLLEPPALGTRKVNNFLEHQVVPSKG